MRKTICWFTVAACVLIVMPGCKKNGTRHSIVSPSANSGAASTKSNPTTRAGRGKPTLDDPHRAAAWIYVDGQEGAFTTNPEGEPLVEWIVGKPVSSAPTFRLEVDKRLLGKKVNANFVLLPIASEEGTNAYYALAGDPAHFTVGKDYSLTNPGNDVVIRNLLSEDKPVVDHIEPLKPGKYGLTAAVSNAKTGDEVLAVTYFTVAK